MKKQNLVRGKILRREDIPGHFTTEVRRHKKLVFTNGCFDILHKGHLYLLESASNLGEILIVGLNSDSSVSRLKGPDRPLMDEQSRAELLASLVYVDYVVLFTEDTPEKLIGELKPDVLVKGGDYKKEEVVGYDILRSSGGEVHIVPFLKGHSSSSLIQKLK